MDTRTYHMDISDNHRIALIWTPVSYVGLTLEKLFQKIIHALNTFTGDHWLGRSGRGKSFSMCSVYEKRQR